MPPIDPTLAGLATLAGSEVSTGYFGVDRNGHLVKAAAHRTMTGKNAGELAAVRQNAQGNKAIRTAVYKRVYQSITRQCEQNILTPESAANLRRLAREMLGIQLEEKVVGNLWKAKVTQAPLERRTVRNLLQVLNHPQLHQVLADPNLDDATGADANQKRQTILRTMNNGFSGIRWKELPIRSMSNASLRQMGEKLLRGELRTMDDLRSFCGMKARLDTAGKINSVTVVQQLHHAQSEDPDGTLVTFNQPAPKVEEHGPEQGPQKLEGQHPKEPVQEAPKPMVQTAVEREKQLGIVSSEELDKSSVFGKGGPLEGRKLDENLLGNGMLETMKIAGSLLLNAPLQQKTVKLAAILNDPKKAAQVVSNFVSAALETAFKPNGDFKALIMGNRKALAVLACASDQQREAILSQVPMGDMLKEPLEDVLSSFESMRSIMNAGSIGIVYDALAEMLNDEESDISGQIEEMAQMIRGDEDLERINGEIASQGPQGMMGTLRANLDKALLDVEHLSVESAANHLVAVLADNQDALIALLTHTDEMLPAFGDVKTLKPFIDGFKKAIAGKLGDENLNCFTPQAAGMLCKAFGPAIGGLLEQIQGNKELMEKLGPAENTKVFSKVLAALLDTSGKSEIIRAAEGLERNVTGNDVRNMLADFVLERDTWVSDSQSQPGERMKMMVERHLKTLAAFVSDPVKYARQLSLPAEAIEFADAIKKQFSPLDLLFSPENEGFAYAALQEAVKNMALPQFAQLENGISQVSEMAMNEIQVVASHAFEALLKGESVGDFRNIFDDIEEDNRLVVQWQAAGKGQEEIDALLAEHRDNRAFERSLEGLTEAQAEEKRAARQEELDYKQSLKAAQGNDAEVARIIQERKDLLESRFAASLDGKSIKDAIDLWAKHHFYDKPSRAKLKALFLKKNPRGDDPVSTVRGQSTLTAKLEAFIQENRMNLKKFKDPETMTTQEKRVWELQESELKDIAGAGALDTTQGYGKFMVDVMKQYFGGVSRIDQRSMLASLLREGRFEPIPKDATPEQADKINRDNLARNLGALFKGAGPIMQKLLQQLGSTSISEEFKLALDDMKSNLLPIPQEVIHAQLLGILERYNDLSHLNKDPSHPLPVMTGIHVEKNLGAASVGQTLLCTLEFEDHTTRRVAVKLLRPDVENRLNREKKLFLDVAKTIDGMEKTYQGRLDRLMEELDLRIEATNVKIGEVYDRRLKLNGQRYEDVKSMKLDAEIPPTRDTMVLECARGSNVSDYLISCEQKLKALCDKADSVGLSGTNARVVKELDDLIDDMMAKQKQLSHLSHKWVEEGLFKSGFYHGDLHAGNIMVDTEKEGGVDHGLTVIDFGNATSLNSDDVQCIMRMVYGAGDGDPDVFLDNYRSLLKPESRAQFDQVRADARARLTEIFKKGEFKNVGERILGAMTELQKFNLEMPAQIFNFSQCQILLQGTLEKVNTQLQQCIDARERIHQQNAPGQDIDLYDYTDIQKKFIEMAAAPGGVNQLTQEFDANVSLYRTEVVKYFKNNPQAAEYLNKAYGANVRLFKDDAELDPQQPDFLGEESAVEADPHRAENLSVENLDPRLAKAALNALLEDMHARDITPEKEFHTAMECLSFMLGWDANKSEIKDLKDFADSSRRLGEIQTTFQQISIRRSDCVILKQDINDLPEDFEIPQDLVYQDNPEIVKLLKGCMTRQEISEKLAAELGRLRQKPQLTDAEQENFQIFSEFKNRFDRTPPTWMPRPPLEKVPRAMANVPEGTPRTKAGITAALQTAKTTCENKLKTLHGQAKQRMVSRQNIDKLDKILENFIKKFDSAKASDLVDFQDPFVLQVLQAEGKQWPDPATKSQLRDVMEAAIRGMDTQQGDVEHQEGTLKVIEEALKELGTTAANWGPNEVVAKVPSLPQWLVDELGGKPATPANTKEALEEIVAKGEQEVLPLQPEYEKLSTSQKNSPKYQKWMAFCARYTIAEMFYQKADNNFPGNPAREDRQDFLEVMGDVVDSHRVRAGFAVGPLTALKAIFS